MRSNIGEKVRIKRKSLGLTQQQLAGDGITRNMLSLIENGSSMPSVQSLEYLADRLGVSVAYFFMDDYNSYDKSEETKRNELRKLYKEKKFEECVDNIKKYYRRTEDMPDEILLICAESAMYVGRKKTLKGAFESAGQYLSKAREYSLACSYSTEWIDANVFLYEAIIENSDCPIQSLDKDYYMKIRRSTGYEYFNYLYAIRLIDEKRGEDAAQFLKYNKTIEPSHKEHLNAKFMMLSDNNDLKAQALDILCNMIKKAPSYPLDAITRYLILKDIEYAARALDNFEMAYKYASMRLKIISDMRD